ncbi:hypothetical protein [Haliea sp. E17]|uniref:dioxygenase family protein n=1 Tax=Haliea sp. E17 TaxID=3401576 RepID=UPI003AB034CE
MAATVTLVPLLPLAGCGGGGGGGATAGLAASDASAATGTGATADDTTDSSGEEAVSNDSDWLSGGTSAMQADFPPSDPFASGLGNTCTLTREYTLGPCYFQADEFAQDISAGEPGVPMALVLKLVDQACEPIADANIEIWFVNWEGIYSGDTTGSANTRSFNSGYCTGGDSGALASRWFRGVQTTDANGLVYFKCCFPGWYASRTTHIHVRIVRNNSEALVTQFCFDDDLCNDIYLNNPDYTGQAKDTGNNRDNVFGSDYADYQFEVERQWDSSMLAYKAIQIA